MHEILRPARVRPRVSQRAGPPLDERPRPPAAWRRLGLFAGAALLLLASVFGYFRLDNATRGYYTGRLQFMTAAAILAVVGAGAVLAQWIHWL